MSTDRLAQYHFIAGGAFLLGSLACKVFFPTTLGSSFFIQGPCAFFSSVLIPLSSILTVHALIFQNGNRRELMTIHLCSVIVPFLLLAFYFHTFVVVNRAVHLPEALPVILPKLVEGARSFPKEEDRERAAHYAYRYFGTIAAYRRDDLQVVYYVPSEDDKTYRRTAEKNDLSIQRKITSIQRLLGQYPYLFGLYVSTYLCAFIIGGLWLYFKIPAEPKKVLT